MKNFIYIGDSLFQNIKCNFNFTFVFFTFLLHSTITSVMSAHDKEHTETMLNSFYK